MTQDQKRFAIIVGIVTLLIVGAFVVWSYIDTANREAALAQGQQTPTDQLVATPTTITDTEIDYNIPPIEDKPSTPKTEDQPAYNADGSIHEEPLPVPEEPDDATKEAGGTDQLEAQQAAQKPANTSPKTGDTKDENGVHYTYYDGVWYPATGGESIPVYGMGEGEQVGF